MSDELLTESEKQQIAMNAVEAWDKERESSFAAPAGYAAPICPRCFHAKSLGKMKQDASTLNWQCVECRTCWDGIYLQGWNDGYKAAQHNDGTKPRRD